jgi:hypothetical protein
MECYRVFFSQAAHRDILSFYWCRQGLCCQMLSLWHDESPNTGRSRCRKGDRRTWGGTRISRAELLLIHRDNLSRRDAACLGAFQSGLWCFTNKSRSTVVALKQNGIYQHDWSVICPHRVAASFPPAVHWHPRIRWRPQVKALGSPFPLELRMSASPQSLKMTPPPSAGSAPRWTFISSQSLRFCTCCVLLTEATLVSCHYQVQFDSTQQQVG